MGGPIGQWTALLGPDLVEGPIPISAFYRTFGWGGEPPLVPAGKELAMGRAEMEHNAGLMEADRLPRIAEPLLKADQADVVREIQAPTLVIVGSDDRIVGVRLQREMALLVPGARFETCHGYGHGDYLENPNYLKRVDEFVVAA